MYILTKMTCLDYNQQVISHARWRLFFSREQVDPGDRPGVHTEVRATVLLHRRSAAEHAVTPAQLASNVLDRYLHLNKL